MFPVEASYARIGRRLFRINLRRFGCLAFALLGLLPGRAANSATGAAGEPWREMDYGPFLTASIDVPGPRTNIAYKGIAVNLGRAVGSTRNEAIVFDTDLLRYAAGWTGGFVALKGVVFDGEHWAYPRIDGPEVFHNPPEPGWAGEGGFHDPRPQPFGPLPRSWARWKGLHVHGSTVVFRYEVGDTLVLEQPGLEPRGDLTAFARTLNLGESRRRHSIQVLQEPGRRGGFRRLGGGGNAERPRDSAPAAAHLAVWTLPDGVVDRADGSSPAGPGVLAVGLRGGPPGAAWSMTDQGDLRLDLPAGPATRLKMMIWRGRPEELPEFENLVRQSVAPEDLEPLTRGGPRHWRDTLVTRGRRSPETSGPYAVDELTAPEDNPWRSWMRFGAMDFFADGRAAAVSTWNGDVWIVSGIDETLERLEWQRVATGLFQPLGLKIVDEIIHVLGRDQITRLRDTNGDGETDFYENFNNDGLVSEHFHEFATDLKLGPDGDFYYLKCARHALPALHAHHGTLLRVSRDGSRLEVVARGFRAVNGLGMGPAGEFTTIDNQGHWMPANRLNWVKPGGWYGNQWAWNPEGRDHYDEPLCWMHNAVDRSGGTQLWIPGDGWGPLKGELITISYGMGHLFLVLKETAGDLVQGAVTRLPLDFETGVMRGVFHPVDQQLYLCGLYGWAGNKTRAGGLYRVRHTGRPLNLARELHVARDGLLLGYTDPLDPSTATDPGNFEVKAWNYRWSAQYGSPDFRSDGTEGRDTWRVTSATLSADGRTVFLEIPEIRRTMQWHLEYRLSAADGSPLRNFVHGTIHRVGERPGRDFLGPGARSRSSTEEIRLLRAVPGLAQSLRRSPADPVRDRRPARLPALYVPAGETVSPFLDQGPFHSRWQGYLKLDLNDTVAFRLEGRGRAQLRIDGELVAESRGDAGSAEAGRSLELSRGLRRFDLEYDAPATGDAELRVNWISARHGVEPVPSTVFVHEGADPDLRRQGQVREGRRLFAERQCGACHRPEGDWGAASLPELKIHAPALDGIGSRLRADWLGRWLLHPAGERADAWMPQLLNGPLAERDAEDVAVFLASLREDSAGTDRAPVGTADEGGRLYGQLGCAACHELPEDEADPTRPRIPLDRLAAKWQPGELAKFLRNPARRHAWTRMPDFKLETGEAANLAAYLVARGAAGRPAHPVAGPPAGIARGRELVSTLGCLACHTLEGVRNQAVAPSLEVVARGDWTRGCLAEREDARGRAPRYSLPPDAVAALREFRQAEALETLRRDGPVEFSARQVPALRCQACHPRDLEPDWLSSGRGIGHDAAEDEEGSGSGSVHVGRPPLTHTGEKLYGEWVHRLLAGTLPYSTRSSMQGRMPSFPAYARRLAEGLAHEHGYPFEEARRQVVDPALADAGRQLTLVEGGFSCVSCHDVGARQALAGKDTATINFAIVPERLRPSYYWRYVQDPTRLVPGTMMPRFIGDDGTTSIKTVFEGDPRRQFEAIWHYFHSLPPLAGPRP